jgi:para-nitrobenzyl esterase
MQPVQLVQFLFLGLFGFLGLLGVEAFASGPIVPTQYGDVRGVLQGQVESFKALPFAAPPIGKLRWMPPQEPAGWTGIRDASNFSPKCPQKRPEDDVFVGSEDCLYLNVFKPAGASALPVIVFIHGGSNVYGSASQAAPNLVAFYDGSQLAQNENVVVVTLNYRLGALGFIGHKKLSEASGYGASGNYAYMDQIQALKWVQRNIAAFGGDPSNVTLFGQSAGAKGVWVHMSSPLSKGLFHRAIVDSALKENARPFGFAEQVGAELSHKLNCSNATDELACMRDKSAKAIVDALPSAHGSGLYAVVVDGKVLTDSPIDMMQSGHHNHVPILQGNVEEEGSVLNDEMSRNIKTQEDYITAVWELARNMPPDTPVVAVAVELLRLYPLSEYGSPRQAFNAIFADKDYICSSRRVLRALSDSQTEFFVGQFFYTHAYSDGPLVKYGASHGFELLFIFDTLGAAQFSPTPGEAALVKTFQDTWAGFARTGTAPPSWKRYDAHKENYVIFDTQMSEGDHLRMDQCDFWDTLFGP